MATPAPLIKGSLSAHPAARSFADEVHRLHRRYAGEVVAANHLCPFLKDVDTGFGAFCVMLDPSPEPSIDLALEAILASKTQVIHLVYPLILPAPSAFERFSGKVSVALKKALPAPPVMATFHPDLAGDATDAHRLVGVLRHAPDPFIQLIPEGLHQGGTTFAPLPKPGEPIPKFLDDPSTANFKSLGPTGIARVQGQLAEIRGERDRVYAPFLKELLG